MELKTNNTITFSSIGVASYMVADIIHEVIGHGGICLLIGNKIELLTSVYFKSTPGSFITDLGGPISNLLFAILIYAILKLRKVTSLLPMFLLMNILFYDLFWFSGTLLQSSFSKTGDWTFAMTELSIGRLGKPITVIAGITAYFFSIRITRTMIIKFKSIFPDFPLQQSIYYSYFVAVVAAIIAGFFFKQNRLHSAFEGLLEMFGSIPLLFMKFRTDTKVESSETKSTIIFNIIIGVLFIVFCLTLGRGYSF